MYIERVPNRNSRPAILLREGFRQDGKVVKRTLANLTHWPQARVEALRAVLKGGAVADEFEIVRSRHHGHVAAVLGAARKLGLEQILDRQRSEQRELCMAMIVARILAPRSKLATVRGFAACTGSHTLAEELNLGEVAANDLYAAMDWLLGRQARIEKSLAKKHLGSGTLVLYDLSSTYFEGRHCELARYGYSRDGQKGKLQIVFGLLCNAQGCPVAVEVFEGNTADPATLSVQIGKVRERFGLKRVVLVGDRGMLTDARIREELEPVEGLDWISALRAPAIRKLADAGTLQMSLFDERRLAEVTSEDFPGERLIVCRNPLLASERGRKRQELLQSTERELERIVMATQRHRQPLRGSAAIGERVGKVIGKYKMAKHFRTEISDSCFRYARNEQSIHQEAALDGIYVVRTSVTKEVLSAERTVAAYKGLSAVERAFRSHKTVDLKVRPIFHRSADRVRAHVLICMLAYYVEWHMRQKLAPMLFDDEQPEQGEAKRSSVVAPAERSDGAKNKASTKSTDDGMPVHSFHTLLDDLATITKNRIQPSRKASLGFDRITRPTELQQRAFDLLGLTAP